MSDCKTSVLFSRDSLVHVTQVCRVKVQYMHTHFNQPRRCPSPTEKQQRSLAKRVILGSKVQGQPKTSPAKTQESAQRMTGAYQKDTEASLQELPPAKSWTICTPH